MQNHPKPGQIYRHYKSSGGSDYTYEIVAIAKNTETDELLVVYKPLYPLSHWLLESHVDTCCRPLEMFLGQVEVNGVVRPRFELIIKD